MGNTTSDIKTKPSNSLQIQKDYLTLMDDPSPSSDTLTSSPLNTPFTPFTPFSATPNSFTPILINPIPFSSFPSTSINRISLTDRIVSDRLSELASIFWRNNIEPLSLQNRLEIASTLWIGMLSDTEISDVASDQFIDNNGLETTALKILDMFGFIVRSVCTTNAHLPLLLQQLGQYHTKMGVKFEHYRIMLKYINRTFKHHFSEQYTETVKFAVNEVFAYAVQLMIAQDINITSTLDDLSFLSSLRYCVKHRVGREYMFKYLHHVYCDEIVVFLHLLSVYKSTSNAFKRLLIAQQIAEMCITFEACFAVNISYETRQEILQTMRVQTQRGSIGNIVMDIDFFIDVEDQIYRLIVQSHWKKFKMHMQEMYLIE